MFVIVPRMPERTWKRCCREKHVHGGADGLRRDGAATFDVEAGGSPLPQP
jgi:hypothetical protein